MKIPLLTGCRIVLAAALACIAGCRDVEVVTNTYATHAEARQAGAVERGWMPRGLPAGAFELREAHDPDTNRRWGLFSFQPGDTDALRALLGAPVRLGGQKCDPPRRIEWWPVLLRGRLDDAQLAATGLQGYRLAPEGLAFAVNWSQRRAYYWSPE